MLRITIKQIAEQCGVSVASVSKALNHAPDIGPQTAERIRNTAKEMGYFPNAAAQALKKSKSNNIGIILESSSNLSIKHEYFLEILTGFRSVIEQKGYDTTFLSPTMGVTGMSYLEHARYRGFDGILVEHTQWKRHDLQELVNCGIPVVTVDYVHGNNGAVLSDNQQGMQSLVQYVYEKGHRKIAFIHGTDVPVTRIRLAAFYNACEQLGLEIPEEYVLESGFNDMFSAAVATRQLLQLADRPTCILYADDVSAIGGMNELHLQGLRVPEDMSVTGYDGFLISSLVTPKLTTIHQDAETIGHLAAAELLKAIESPRSYLPQRHEVPCLLVAGETVQRI